jgi:tRNA threonylcarbamoyladenosine biosynthesis protein TsaB
VRVLGIETATWTASVGVIDGGQALAERTRRAAGSHAVSLIPLIDEVLAAAGTPLSAIHLIAVSIGPGSFTGLRIGLSIAKGLALAASKPVVGVPTLTAMAHAAGPRDGVLLCPVLDARKREVYAAQFARSAEGLEPLWEPAVLTPEALAERLRPPCLVFGDGVDEYEPTLRRCCGDGIELLRSSQLAPSALAVAALAGARFLRRGGDDVARLEPAYLRLPEAEEGRQAIEIAPFSQPTPKLTAAAKVG